MSDEKLDTFRITDLLDGGLRGTRADGRVGELTPTQEGQPLQPGEELVQVFASEEQGTVRLRTLYKHGGPSRASTPAYRDGYDAVFGRKVKAGDLN